MSPEISFEIELLRQEAFNEPSQMIEKELVGGIECLIMEVSRLGFFTGYLGNNMFENVPFRIEMFNCEEAYLTNLNKSRDLF